MHSFITILSHIPVSGIYAFHHYHLKWCSYLRNTCIPSFSSSLQSWVMFLSQECMHFFITILSIIPILGMHVFLHYNLEQCSYFRNTCTPSLSSWIIFLSQECMHSFITILRNIPIAGIHAPFIIILSIIPISGMHAFLHYHLESYSYLRNTCISSL